MAGAVHQGVDVPVLMLFQHGFEGQEAARLFKQTGHQAAVNGVKPDVILDLAAHARAKNDAVDHGLENQGEQQHDSAADEEGEDIRLFLQPEIQKHCQRQDEADQDGNGHKYHGQGGYGTGHDSFSFRRTFWKRNISPPSSTASFVSLGSGWWLL